MLINKVIELEQKTLTKIKPDTNLGILVGLLLTDGSVCHTKSGHWRIKFMSKSEELHKIFTSVTSRIFGVSRFHEWFDSKSGVKQIVIESKEIFDKLTAIVPTFRTLPVEEQVTQARIPEFIFKLPKEQKAEILRVMFSTDGFVSLVPRWVTKDKCWRIDFEVTLRSKHPVIKQQIGQLLEEFGIKPIIDDTGVQIFKKSEIKIFSKEIGFVKCVKISTKSKIWKGFDKTQILDLTIKTFDMRKKDLQKFETREEIVSFLKTFLTSAEVAS